MEIATMAGTAGATIVTLMATEGWERARDGVVALWRRVQPERSETVAAELEATREDLVSAGAEGDEEVLQELQAEWRGRLRRLLTARPEVASDLRQLIEELAPDTASSGKVAQHATASGQARVYQAGRDQHVTER